MLEITTLDLCLRSFLSSWRVYGGVGATKETKAKKNFKTTFGKWQQRAVPEGTAQKE
jgi:hypothetical protein